MVKGNVVEPSTLIGVDCRRGFIALGGVMGFITVLLMAFVDGVRSSVVADLFRVVRTRTDRCGFAGVCRRRSSCPCRTPQLQVQGHRQILTLKLCIEPVLELVRHPLAGVGRAKYDNAVRPLDGAAQFRDVGIL